jgi:hypothetical protein
LLSLFPELCYFFARNAETEFLYDQPYEDKSAVHVVFVDGLGTNLNSLLVAFPRPKP